MAYTRATNTNGEHAFRTIENDLSKGSFSDVGCVLLFGTEPYLTETYEKKIVERFVSSTAAMFDAIRYDGSDFSADDVIGACDTLPMMSEKRVVVIASMPGDERGLGSSDAHKISEYLPNMPATTLLLITASAFSKRSLLYKAILKNGNVYEFNRLAKADAKSFVRSRFKSAGVKPTADAVDELLHNSGYSDSDDSIDLYSLSGDVKRVAAYALSGDTVDVTLSDVRACMGTSVETDVFALLDAVSGGNKGKALEMLMGITARDESAFRLLALFISQFEIMLGWREMTERGMSMNDIGVALGVKSAYRLKKAAGFAKNYSEKQLLSLLSRLYRVDSDIKSGIYDERLALTMFISEM